ncbi:MAG: ABC transporter ATP-binding protein [Candidatus Kapaibacteriota bacterium]|jgi:ABC-2 type transport system ATP-binding protein
MLTVQHVTKRYGSHVANADISLTAASGRIFGLLGPNGAGKSTLIRMITNIIQPDEGTIRLHGEPIGTRTMENIGYLPEERGLYKKLTVIEQLCYFGQLKGLSEKDARDRAAHWLSHLDAAGWEGKKVQELSKGMQQKVQFISTIMHDPQLVILDEPFSGLDPVNAQLLIDTVRQLQQRGATILLSTHQMDQVEKLCDDLALIHRGQVMLQGSLTDVRSAFRSDRIRLTCTAVPDEMLHIPGTTVEHHDHRTIDLHITDPTLSTNDVLARCLPQAEVMKFEVVQPSLHDIFVHVVTGTDPSYQDDLVDGSNA